MMFTRFALVTRAFYLGFNILLGAAFLGLSLWKGGASIFASRGAWALFFGAIWLVSFLAPWKIVLAPIFARIPR
jgi:hypothetical protein